jgi:ferredoxin--NADP+ reductase
LPLGDSNQKGDGLKTQNIESKNPVDFGRNSHVIISKKSLNSQVTKITFVAQEIAEKAQAGQFVILRIDEEGERIPLTLFDWTSAEGIKGTITLIFQHLGVSTKKLAALNVGDKILNVVGPLGNPSCIQNYGVAAIVCGGVGTAAAYPIAKALKAAGNKVVSILGARNKELLILEDEMKAVSDEFYISTDDGSEGQKGFVSDVLKSLIEKKYQFSIVYAIGPVPMMKATAEVTRSYGIKTIVSLNPIMVDGMGMCGSCRVTVGGATKFACIDGPEFDAHKTDFKELMSRLKEYPSEEKSALAFREKGEGATCPCSQH